MPEAGGDDEQPKSRRMAAENGGAGGEEHAAGAGPPETDLSSAGSASAGERTVRMGRQRPRIGAIEGGAIEWQARAKIRTTPI